MVDSEKLKALYEAGVLDEEYHARLIQSLPLVMEQAGIPKKFILGSAKDFVPQADLEWLRSYAALREEGSAGLVYVGVEDASIRLMALVGAFIRNYIDARFVTLQDVLEKLKNGVDYSPSVVAMPNFFSGTGASVPSWQASQLLGWLYDRHAKEKTTLLYVSSMEELKKTYGDAMYQHIKSSYIMFTGAQ